MSLKDKLNIVLDESEEKAINLADRNEKKAEITNLVKNFLGDELTVDETFEEIKYILNI